MHSLCSTPPAAEFALCEPFPPYYAPASVSLSACNPLDIALKPTVRASRCLCLRLADVEQIFLTSLVTSTISLSERCCCSPLDLRSASAHKAAIYSRQHGGFSAVASGAAFSVSFIAPRRMMSPGSPMQLSCFSSFRFTASRSSDWRSPSADLIIVLRKRQKGLTSRGISLLRAAVVC
jgi:hypothetical protein